MTPRPDPPGGPLPRFFLVVEGAPSAAEFEQDPTPPPAKYLLDRRETIIGRGEASTIRLDHPLVSERHARVLRRDRDLHVDDLGSTNSTRVNGEEIATRVAVYPGDTLEFAQVRCRVAAEDDPGAETAASPAPPASGKAPGKKSPKGGAPGPAARPASEEPDPDASAQRPGDRSRPSAPTPRDAAPGEAESEDGTTPDPGPALPQVHPAGPFPDEPRRSRIRAAGVLALILLGVAATLWLLW